MGHRTFIFALLGLGCTTPGDQQRSGDETSASSDDAAASTSTSSSTSSTSSTSTGDSTEGTLVPTDTGTVSTDTGADDPPVFDCGDTPLGQLAMDMEPRTWAELGEGLGPLLSSPIYEHPEYGKVGGLDIMTWSDDAQWDSATGQFFYMGLRQTRRFVVYTAADGVWREVPLPMDHRAAMSPPFFSQFGHIYSRNALDPVGGNVYHMDHNTGGGIYRFDIADETWSKLPEGGAYGMTGVIEWFSARGELLNYAAGSTVLMFDEADQSWEDLGPIALHGHHSLGRDNPFREEILLAGGNDTPRSVFRVKKDGTIEQLPDAPLVLTIQSGMITADPVTGRYLILDLDERVFYEFDSDTGEYVLLDDFTRTPWPFGTYDAPVVAFIPECGVTMWASTKIDLYKHG